MKKQQKKQLKQIQNQAQEGRSMVEMLGVLAIIGVISLGGIAGYRMAMNRYQANQIANEINLMRTDAKIKVAQGVEKLLLGAPYDGDNGHLNFNANYGVAVKFEEIGTDTPGETEKGYSFTLSNIPEGVCKPLATLLDNMDDTAVLEINGKDYETAETPCDNEENEVMVAFSTKDIGGASGNPEVTDPDQGDEPQDPECNEDTCPGECQDDGTCQCSGTDEHWTGTDCIMCPTGTTWSDAEKDCTCPGANEHWDGNRCVDCGSNEWDEENKECKCDEGKYWSDSAGECIENPCNKDGQGCAADEFCLSSSCSNTCSTSQMTEEDSCKNGTYKCEKIDSHKAENKDTEHPNKYVMSSSKMNWWSAERFCNALGKHMVSATELKCKDRFGEDFGYGKSNTWCYCHDDESEKTCTQSSTSEVSSVIKELRKAENGDGTKGNYYYWLYDVYASTTSSSTSCPAYNVHLSDGYVSNIFRNYGSRYALCE